ncbi:ankyrin repeat domain-containing protein [Sphingomonas sp. ID0503]|uniref:ankyrin repeat domain-containing protein n=1 Tax=Sphingomonas sp. ID0503 TaxID=3399691 RepID=UPI003AFB3238
MEGDVASKRWGKAASVAAVVAGLGLAIPATAQFSPSYNFLKAVKDADGAKAMELLGSGGSVINTRDLNTGESALHLVTKRRDNTWLGFLLGKGANPNAKDKTGNTPMLLAATVGWAEGIQTLLSVGGQPNLGNGSGETPLIRAVQNRDLASVRVLVAGGADPNQADTGAGMSARAYAERDGRSQAIIKELDAAKPKKATSIGPVLK